MEGVQAIADYHVSKRHHSAGWKNLLRSLGYLTITVGILYGLRESLWLTVWLAGAAIASVLLWRAVVAARRGRAWYRSRSIVAPLARALALIPGTGEAGMEKAITLKSNYLAIKSGEIGRVTFPDTFRADEAEQEAVENLIRRRFPMPVDFAWHTESPQYVIINASPPLPSMIPFAKKLGVLRDLPGDKILLGTNSKGVDVVWNMASEEPMMFVSATSRRGKTTLAMSLMAQILNRGGYVTAIDPKAIGLDEFCAGHPNAEVYADNTNVETMWAGVRKFREELDARINAYKLDRTITFPRKTLFLDEVSVFNMLSVARWGEIKSSKDKAMPPIWNDIMKIIFAGAQFNVNACVFGQRVDFRTLGGLIDGFGTRLLAGYNRQTYMRLIGIFPVPVSQKPRGRFLYFNNGDEYPEWIQVPYGSIQEMRDYSREPLKTLALTTEKAA